jgi:hypothetical protein
VHASSCLRDAHAACCCRVDARRLAVAHPKLSPAVATILLIPALEHVVVEVLDSFGTSSDNELQSIQVSVAGKVPMGV